MTVISIDTAGIVKAVSQNPRETLRSETYSWVISKAPLLNNSPCTNSILEKEGAWSDKKSKLFCDTRSKSS